MPLRLIKDNIKIDFVKAGRYCSCLSLLAIIISIASLGWRGMNVGIDFAGGTMLEFHCSKENLDVADVRESSKKVVENSLVYSDNAGNFVVKARLPDSVEKEKSGKVESLKIALGEQCGTDNIEYRRTSYVGPQVSKDTIFKGIGAIILAMVGVMAYLCMRFNFYFALSGIVTLMHDVILLFGFYSITWLEFNLSSVAAVLTIVGYSINDSVVIYDRIRDNLRNIRKPELEEIINDSINSTLSRTIFTSLTTLIAATVLVVLGGEIIRTFSWAILFGIVVGTYSSIIISSQCVLWGRAIGYTEM